MNEPGKEKELLQWHPAFFAGLQIELKEEADALSFENEHQLGTKPMAIDVLIIKKETDRPLQKNIGRIFRKYNLVEYKSPVDHLSIDDFYKVYGYACFYKADTGAVNAISIEEITITFASSHFPRKMMKHLSDQGHAITQEGEGIYYIADSRFPIQVLAMSRLPEQENLWLRSLANHLNEKKQVTRLLQDYVLHKEENLYQSVMDLIIRANEDQFKEGSIMCEALERLIEERLTVWEERGRSQGISQGELKNLIGQVCKKLKKAKSPEVIAEELEEELARIQEICCIAKTYAPEYDEEKVLEECLRMQ